MPNYQVLTFDCYGTLIDWEDGMRAALAVVIKNRGLSLDPYEVHGRYEELEPVIQETRGGKYVDVMRMSVRETFSHFGVDVTDEEAGIFGDSLASWPKFSDTTEALTEMKNRGYKLVILSNTDENFIRQSIETIGVEFDEVITGRSRRLVQARSGPLGPHDGDLGGIERGSTPRCPELLPRCRARHGTRFQNGLDKSPWPTAVGRRPARLRIPGPEKPPVHPMT